jgi:hypothetical protein
MEKVASGKLPRPSLELQSARKVKLEIAIFWVSAFTQSPPSEIQNPESKIQSPKRPYVRTPSRVASGAPTSRKPAPLPRRISENSLDRKFVEENYRFGIF